MRTTVISYGGPAAYAPCDNMYSTRRVKYVAAPARSYYGVTPGYVAVQSDATSWQIEAAIPLGELTGSPIGTGQTWAGNVVRTLPGRGVQAFSTPADAIPRPDGMGLFHFPPLGKSVK